MAQRPSDFVEMRRVAEALAARGYAITFLYHCLSRDLAHDGAVPEQLAEMERSGVLASVELITALGTRARRGTSESGGALPTGRARELFIMVANSTAGPVLRRLILAARFCETVWRYPRYRRFFRRLVDKHGVDVLILPEDVVGLVTPIAIKVGHDRNVPSIIVPYTIANQREAFQSLKSQATYQLGWWPNRIVGLLFPRWVMRADDHALVRLPAPHVIGHAVTGTAPPDPWMLNSGFANCVAVENDAMRDYYLAGGLPPGKLRVVGAIYDDHLARYLNDKPAELEVLRRELGIEGDKPLAVIGGCPNQIGRSPGFAFDDMAAFAAYVADCLAPLGASHEIIFRPHPNDEELAGHFSDHGIRATTIETARLVALADLYVAFASATIRWAIACGVPTVNYDVFEYDYDDFKDEPGVVTVMRKDAFRSAIRELDRAGPSYADRKRRAEQARHRWGTLDGRSTDRIVALIEELSALSTVPRTAV